MNYRFCSLPDLIIKWLSKTSVLLFILGLFLLSGCSTSRYASRQERQLFFAEHSRILGFELTGKENPVLIREAGSWLGTPYVYGGTNRRGADCSGFVLSVYRSVYDYYLPRQASDMAKYSRRVRKRNLKEGNLVFFRTQRRKITHVGIYLGQGYFIHASTSRGVMVNNLNEPYYRSNFAYGGRVNK